jgi:Family of unknown function (DUF6789)
MGGKKSAISARALKWALIGSLLGTLAMDLVMVVESLIIGMPVLNFFALIGSVVGGGAPIGAVIHLLVGSTLGLLFGLAVDQIRFLRIDSVHKGVWLGLLVGLVTIPLGCVPFAVLVGVSILELVSFSFIPHLVWGAVMGVVVGYGLASGPRPVELRTAN